MKVGDASASAKSSGGDPYFSARHLQSFARVGAAVPSPSGRHLVFTVRALRETGGVGSGQMWYHEDSNKDFVSGLWLADVSPAMYNTKTLHAAADSKAAPAQAVALDSHSPVRRLTHPPEKKSDSEPVWLDDSTVAFLSTRSGSNQLWCISITGGEAQQLSAFPVGIDHLRFNSVRSFVAFAAAVYPDLSKPNASTASSTASTAPAPSHAPASTATAACTPCSAMVESAKRDEAVKKRAANYQKFDRLFMRRWDTFTDAKRTHIFVQPIHKVHNAADPHSTAVWALASSPVDVRASGSPPACAVLCCANACVCEWDVCELKAESCEHCVLCVCCAVDGRFGLRLPASAVR